MDDEKAVIENAESVLPAQPVESFDKVAPKSTKRLNGHRRFKSADTPEHRMLWAAFLRVVHRKSKKFAQEMQIFYHFGAGLQPHSDGSYKITSDNWYDGPEGYAVMRSIILVPQAEVLLQCLREVNAELDRRHPEARGVDGPTTTNMKNVVLGARTHDVVTGPFDPSRIIFSVLPIEKLGEECEAAMAAGLVGMDTETQVRPELVDFLKETDPTGRWLKDAPLDPHIGQIRLLQIAVPGRPVAIFDLRLVIMNRRGEFDVLFAPLLKLLADPTTAKIFHNAKFDLKHLRGTLGGKPLVLNAIYDVMLAEQLLACGQWHTEGYKLRSVAKRVLGYEMDKTEQNSDWSNPNLSDEQIQYSALDPAILLWLYINQRKRITDNGLDYTARIEFDVLPMVSDMEYEGIALDLPYWTNMATDVKARMVEAEKKAYELLPVPASARPVKAPKAPKAQLDLFSGGGSEEEAPVVEEPKVSMNLNSSKQVLDSLHLLGLASLENTNEDTLTPYAAENPAVAALLEYRHLAKQVQAFLDPIPTRINPLTRRIHASYHQLNRNGVGRFSCSDPNIQQIPHDKAYRIAFKAEEEKDRVLIICDYSQIELRIMCKLSGDRTMFDSYKAGIDLHKRTASVTSGKPLEEVTKSDRQKAKAVNFGLVYGMSAGGLMEYAANNYGVQMTLEEAQEARSRYFNEYRSVVAYHNRQNTRARSAKEVRTLSGRARRWQTTEMPATVLYNTPDQGTGADILKRAMHLVREFVVENGAMMVACVHDEIVIECPRETSEKMKSDLERCMVDAGNEFLAPVPVEAEAAIGKTWADKA